MTEPASKKTSYASKDTDAITKDAIMASLMLTRTKSNGESNGSGIEADSSAQAAHFSGIPAGLEDDHAHGTCAVLFEATNSDIFPSLGTGSEKHDSLPVNEPAPTDVSSPSPPSLTSDSLLERSGLMSAATSSAVRYPSGNGGGLFDEIDKEEERRRVEDEERRREVALIRQDERQKDRSPQERTLEEGETLGKEEFRTLHEGMQDVSLNMHGLLHAPHPTEVLVNPPPAPSQAITCDQQQATQIQNQAGHDPRVQLHPVRNHVFQSGAPQASSPVLSHRLQLYDQYQRPQMQQQPRMCGGVPRESPSLAYRGYDQHAAAPFTVSYPSTGSALAGMHNLNPSLGVAPARYQDRTNAAKPPPPTVTFGKVIVSEPLLISSSGASLFGLRQPPYWSYQIQTTFASYVTTPMGNWLVRRRFRHVVALEERLRQECPGSILPPRPDKHAARALEEATAQQSLEFATQRALELQCYLNALIQHPYARIANALRLFLSLQDDLGTAWVEVSQNTLTRLANASVGAAMSLSETTTRGMGVFNHDEYLPEDSADLLTLQSAEVNRMGAVSQAVPKLEGCVALLKEQAEVMGSAGVELQKTKSLEDLQPFEVLANGMLRSARRSKRCVVDVLAAIQPFSYHYKLIRNERLAFSDRRMALLQRAKERSKADHRAAQLVLQQRQLGGYNRYGGGDLSMLDRLERDAAVSDDLASGAIQECEEIGRRLVAEVARTAHDRRTEWRIAVVGVANLMKETTTERIFIWESVRVQFLASFPESEPHAVSVV